MQGGREGGGGGGGGGVCWLQGPYQHNLNYLTSTWLHKHDFLGSIMIFWAARIFKPGYPAFKRREESAPRFSL